MALADARCPRCGFAAADVWREEHFADRRVRSVVCRSCAFVFPVTEPPVSSPYPLTLVHVADRPASPPTDPLFVRVERLLVASREQRDELRERRERVQRARELAAAAKDHADARRP
jgi:hypothetical protein